MGYRGGRSLIKQPAFWVGLLVATLGLVLGAGSAQAEHSTLVVEGTVALEGGASPAGAVVTLTPQLISEVHEGTSVPVAADGSYQVDLVVPDGNLSGFSIVADPPPGEPYRSGFQSIIAGATAATVDFELAAREPIMHGTITDPAGRPFTDVHVAVGPYPPSDVAETGEFSVSAPFGSQDFAVSRWPSAAAFVTVAPVDFERDVEFDIVLPPEHTVTVTVIDEAGEPVPGANVSVASTPTYDSYAVVGEPFEAAPGLRLAATNGAVSAMTDEAGRASVVAWEMNEAYVRIGLPGRDPVVAPLAGARPREDPSGGGVAGRGDRTRVHHRHRPL